MNNRVAFDSTRRPVKGPLTFLHDLWVWPVGEASDNGVVRVGCDGPRRSNASSSYAKQMQVS
eukprot:CAMPEP_0195007014 /NCGR_PEP_ID=MMETSP0326_2-20130528/7245_1 /TAXON_ID=2866 ORGANISM="Crypthecodinium cohnii, Strain Seligo" /NCGR_SAMPLE_ID=MMETSP0326_2 /ASSEMBLY_ACC=CAM_ASM_000348 /LENGTH=61 /DNA_ID=CAMNT_0040014139 /DNA_START=10 /DNA_END=191 /DNA_ORIENTATION=-